ncbi:hypothetical protein [Bathymodiolus thermophilus thioautotrophic gill symbiont]|uniref:hypothetical protein n=1 Tax=Bathymodiolus thermophilus thioautotrophic gill symbiont TaxID=2360 RepID=UPI0018E96633|nr:hypothetical protein [Bathymodiolus thermophilus thioautotrophic gill symbiont]
MFNDKSHSSHFKTRYSRRLQKVLKPVHMRYSQYISKQQNTTGILWQGRFFTTT